MKHTLFWLTMTSKLFLDSLPYNDDRATGWPGYRFGIHPTAWPENTGLMILLTNS